jgi:hypothetical protein
MIPLLKQSIRMKNADELRQERIDEEIIVDCYDDDEVMMGWYYYLEEKLTFPFTARYRASGKGRGKKTTQLLQVVGMADEDECNREIQVMILLQEDGVEDQIPVALSQLEGVEVDGATAEAIADWHYWVG